LVLATVLALVLAAAAPAEKKKLTFDAIFDDLSVPEPEQLRWTPDGRLSYFLEVEDEEPAEADDEKEGDEKAGDEKAGDEKEDEDEDKPRNLWVLDVATGEKRVLVADEDLRRMAPSPTQAGVDERERTRRSRFGVAAYLWSPDGRRILFTSAGQIWLYTVEGGEATLLAPEKKGVRDPKFSPDGEWISFVYEHDVWVVPTGGGAERRLTTGGHELLLHGDLDWVYPEEFRVRTGYHWAPDSRHVAFLEMDESPVPTYPITDQLDRQSTVDLQRYPKPGDPNPKVRVGIVAVDSARTAWLDRYAEYVPRIDWSDDGRLAVQLMNRGQDELELVLADPATGRSRSVLFERDEHWVNVTDDLTFLADGAQFLWTSVRTGLRHVYLYDRDGQLVRRLTDGEFQVESIQGVDEEGGWIYYSANEDNVIGNDLYRVKLDGSAKERLTQGRGTHRFDVSTDATAYVDSFSSLDVTQPGRRTAVDLASGRSTELSRSPDYAAEYELVQPEMIELRAEDGALVRVLLMKPSDLKRSDKRPMVVYVYGMAGFPTIRDSWSGGRRELFHQYLVQEGYFVAYVDDRSSSIPGHKYAVLADHDVGPVAAADHRVAVEHFRSLPQVDGERMAVWGWSGGGFTTAYHMARTDLFKVGVAGAPVTDWHLYDSIYTERYMGLPEEDPEAYERTSAVKGVGEKSGRLLLIHGTHDDNVHPQNTLQMANAMIEARRPFDLMLYPNKTHGIRGESHNYHLYSMMFEYFERHLGGE
jgi:dipeptidyl-peptidase-4